MPSQDLLCWNTTFHNQISFNSVMWWIMGSFHLHILLSSILPPPPPVPAPPPQPPLHVAQNDHPGLPRHAIAHHDRQLYHHQQCINWNEHLYHGFQSHHQECLCLHQLQAGQSHGEQAAQRELQQQQHAPSIRVQQQQQAQSAQQYQQLIQQLQVSHPSPSSYSQSHCSFIIRSRGLLKWHRSHIIRLKDIRSVIHPP